MHCSSLLPDDSLCWSPPLTNMRALFVVHVSCYEALITTLSIICWLCMYHISYFEGTQASIMKSNYTSFETWFCLAKAVIAGYNKVVQIRAEASDLIKCSILVWWEYNRRTNDARQPDGGEPGHLFSAKYHSDFGSHLSWRKSKNYVFLTSNYSFMQYNS